MNRLEPVAISNIPAYVVPSDDAYGVDIVVKAIQEGLSNLEWMGKAFARAVKMSYDKDGSNYVYPAAFVGEGKDFADVMFNDSDKSYSFFYANDPESPIDYYPNINNKYQRNISCIVWMNLNAIDPTRGDDYFSQLKQEVRDVINNTYYTDETNGTIQNVDILDIYDEPDNVFQGFTVDLTETQFLYYPYRAVRFELDVIYLEKCKTTTPVDTDFLLLENGFNLLLESGDKILLEDA